jgi:hypothetical protein
VIGNLFVKVCKLNYVIISNNLNILYYEHVKVLDVSKLALKWINLVKKERSLELIIAVRSETLSSSAVATYTMHLGSSTV